MSYWTNLYRTVADNQLHFFTISNLNYTVFVSLAHIIYITIYKYIGNISKQLYIIALSIRMILRRSNARTSDCAC